MKNVFSSVLFLLVSNFVFGQIEWVGNKAFYEESTNIVPTSQNQYILVQGYGSSITVFNEDGSIVFEKLLNTELLYYYTGISDIIELSDSSIAFTSRYLSCNEFVKDPFYRFDKNWNQVAGPEWTSGLRAGPSAKFSDDSMVFYNNNMDGISKIDPDGNLIWEINPLTSSIRDFVITHEDTLLVASHDNFIKLSSDGDIIASYPNLIFQRLEILPNGDILAQQNSTIYRYGPNLTLLAMKELSDATFMDIAFDSSNIAVLTDAGEVIRLDLDMNLLGTLTLTGQNQSFNTLEMVENGYLIGGGEQYGISSAGNIASFIKFFAMDGTTANKDTDVALANVAIEGKPKAIDSWAYFLGLTDIHLNLENKGSTPIERLNVNLSLFGLLDPDCYHPRDYYKVFEGLHIQPGTSLTVVWDNLEILMETDPTGQEFNLCFWTSLPNNSLETSNENDVNCIIVQLLNEDTLVTIPLAFHYYFNAVTEELHLELPYDLNMSKPDAFVFNATGQLVGKFAIKEQRQSLVLNDLSNGVYFLQVVSSEWTECGKFARY